MLKFETNDNKPPIYINPINVFWVQEKGIGKDGRPKTKILLEGGYTITVDEDAHTVQTRLSEWFDKHYG